MAQTQNHQVDLTPQEWQFPTLPLNNNNTPLQNEDVGARSNTGSQQSKSEFTGTFQPDLSFQERLIQLLRHASATIAQQSHVKEQTSDPPHGVELAPQLNRYEKEVEN